MLQKVGCVIPLFNYIPLTLIGQLDVAPITAVGLTLNRKPPRSHRQEAVVVLKMVGSDSTCFRLAHSVYFRWVLSCFPCLRYSLTLWSGRNQGESNRLIFFLLCTYIITYFRHILYYTYLHTCQRAYNCIYPYFRCVIWTLHWLIDLMC